MRYTSANDSLGTLDITYTLFLSVFGETIRVRRIYRRSRDYLGRNCVPRLPAESHSPWIIYPARSASVMKGNLKRGKSKLVINASRLLINRSSSLGRPRTPISARRCADERVREFCPSGETRLGSTRFGGPKFPLRSIRRKALLSRNFKGISKLFVKRADVISLLAGRSRSCQSVRCKSNLGSPLVPYLGPCIFMK